jgi:hypothetical protein
VTDYEPLLWAGRAVIAVGFLILVDATVVHVVYLCKHWKERDAESTHED